MLYFLSFDLTEPSTEVHSDLANASELDEHFAEYPMLATPCAKASSNCFSPFLLPTPKQTSTPGMCTSWGGEDAKLLQETFSKDYAISSVSSNRSARVYFKDQVSENSGKEETPFLNTLATTPGRTKRHVGLVTGSGPGRTRGNSTLADDRDNLLSTAILATPKSPKIGSIQDTDQSLHHIDAYSMTKSPLNFGSPVMKAAAHSPLRL